MCAELFFSDLLMQSSQKDSKACYYVLQQIHEMLDSSARFVNQTDRCQEADE